MCIRDSQYRARTVVHLLELLDAPTCTEPEFEQARCSIRDCIDSLHDITGEQFPEEVQPMENKAVAFYLMTLVDMLHGLSIGWCDEYLPDVVQEKIEWLMKYFRFQVDGDFEIRAADWN